jgi:hypothetical protein
MQKKSARLSKWLLVACGLVVAAAASSACELAFSQLSAEARDEWTKTFDLAADGRVEIANGNGTVEVEPSRDGKVHVRAERIAKGSTEEGAREVLKKVEIMETAEPGLVRLETKTPSGGMFSSGNARVDYYVEVPSAAAVRVDNSNGRISVREITGRVEAETTNGGVEGRGLAGAVRASTTNGGVDVEVAALHRDGVTLETVNGGVRVALPASAQADISASTVNGGISTSGLTIDTTESSRRRLEGRVNGGGARVQLAVVNGGVRIEGRGGAGS